MENDKKCEVTGLPAEGQRGSYLSAKASAAETVEYQAGSNHKESGRTTVHHTSPIESGEKNAPAVKDPLPLQIWAQTYEELENRRIPIATKLLEDNFKNFVLVERGGVLIILLPICFEGNRAFSSDYFERFLLGIINQFPDHQIHFAVLMTDALERHNWAKIEQNRRTVDYPDKPTNNRPKCLNRNHSFFGQARKQSADWLEDVKLDEKSIKDTEQRIGCKVRVFYWNEITEGSATELRQLFCDRMGINNDPTKMPVDAQFLNTTDLAKFVEHARKHMIPSSGSERRYSGIVDDLQYARLENEKRKYPNLSTYDLNKFDEVYLNEETAGFMRIIGVLGDCIHVFIQPELLRPEQKKRDKRTRIARSIEWLDWQSRELLTLKLDRHFQKLGEKNKIDLYGNHLYRFVSASYLSLERLNNQSQDAPSKMPSTENKIIRNQPDQSQRQDNKSPCSPNTTALKLSLILGDATLIAQKDKHDSGPDARKGLSELGKAHIRNVSAYSPEELAFSSEATEKLVQSAISDSLLLSTASLIAEAPKHYLGPDAREGLCDLGKSIVSNVSTYSREELALLSELTEKLVESGRRSRLLLSSALVIAHSHERDMEPKLRQDLIKLAQANLRNVSTLSPSELAVASESTEYLDEMSEQFERRRPH